SRRAGQPRSRARTGAVRARRGRDGRDPGRGRGPSRPRVQPGPWGAARHRPGGPPPARGARPRAHRGGRPPVTGAGGAAVVVMAYGSPPRIGDVAAYLEDIRGARRPSEAAVEGLTARYR